MDYVDKASSWIQAISGLNSEWQARVLVSLIAIAVLWVVKTVVRRVVWQHTDSPGARYRWGKAIGYFYIIILLLVLARIWVQATESVVYVLGLIGAGLTIALQDLIKSVAGWLFILWRRPFQIGDRIEIGDSIKGDVIDISPFKFTLNEIGKWVDADQSTGRVIHVPNSRILTENIINYTEGFRFIWHEIPVLVTFESDWKKAKKILLDIANKNALEITKDAEKRVKEASKKYLIFYKNLTPIVYTSVKDCGVLLTMRYLSPPRNRRGGEEAIWEDILDAFAEHKDIDFAYPTQRFYDNLREGKTASVEIPGD
jgi:small-conductance mechanosensitive channel